MWLNDDTVRFIKGPERRSFPHGGKKKFPRSSQSVDRAECGGVELE